MPTVEERLAALERSVSGLLASQPASAADMAGERGDPEVRRDPKDWTGPSMVGRKMSECPADFLELYADFLTWRANKEADEGKMWTSKDGSKTKPVSEFTRRDARLARGWAARNRSGAERTLGAAMGAVSPAADEPSDIPF